MNLYRSEGIVLRSRPLGEADKVLTLLTRDKGKMEAVARGARRPRNRLVGAAQPFSYLKVLIFTGKSLPQLSQAEIIRSFIAIRDNLVKTAYASYWMEILDHLLPWEEGNPELFLFTLAALTVLEKCEDPALLSRAFELRVLQYLGYTPQLAACACCGETPGDLPGGFSPPDGGVVCQACKTEARNLLPLSQDGLASMNRLLAADLRSVVHWELPPSRQREIEGALTAFLEYRMEKPLKSLTFLRSILSF